MLQSSTVTPAQSAGVALPPTLAPAAPRASFERRSRRRDDVGAAGRRTCFYVDPLQDPAAHGGYVPSLVTEDTPGHQLMTGDGKQRPWVWGKTLAEAERAARFQNYQLGLTDYDVTVIIASSMRGAEVAR